jgi:hypothetical protein
MQELFEVAQHLEKTDDFEEDFLLKLHYEKYQVDFQEPKLCQIR